MNTQLLFWPSCLLFLTGQLHIFHRLKIGVLDPCTNLNWDIMGIVDQNGQAFYRLNETRMLGNEDMLLSLALLSAMSFIPDDFVRLAVIFLSLLLSAAIDWIDNSLSEGLIYVILFASVGGGFMQGQIISPLMTALIVCLYDRFVGDSDLFGGADFLILAGLFAYVGFLRWLILLILACIFSIVLKLILWSSKKDSSDERGVAFIPGVAFGFVVMICLETVIGDALNAIGAQWGWIVQFFLHRGGQ